MSTSTITLERQSLEESARSLEKSFSRARLVDLRAEVSKQELRISMPVNRLASYQFEADQERYSFAIDSRKVVVKAHGFQAKQLTSNGRVLIVLKQRPSSTAKKAVVAKTGRIRTIFVQRCQRAIENLTSIGEPALAEAVQAPSDLSVLLAALNTKEALSTIREADPLAGARLRGFEAKRSMLEAEGGTLSSAETAALLRITRQAVDKRRRESKLLAVELGTKGYRYPSWQFGLKGLEEVLTALRGRDVWEQLSFFLNPQDALDERTPIEVLRGKRTNAVTEVVQAAQVYGEHGA